MEIKDHKKVMSAIIKKVGNKPCPMCGKLAGFNIEPTEFQNISFLRTTEGLQIHREHKFIPCASAVCNHCGYIMNFALQILLDDMDYLNH